MRRAARLQWKTVQDTESHGHGAPSGSALDPFLRRAILATDGTVSNLIEEFVEPVSIVKLDEYELDSDDIADLDFVQSEDVRVVSREVVIRGEGSGRVFLHAESLIVLDYLDDILRRELLETRKPIGKLIREYRRETYRELLGHHRERAGERALFFACSPDDAIIARRYRIFLGARPAIQITERFLDGGIDETEQP